MLRRALLLLFVVLAEKGEGADFSCNSDIDGDGQMCQCVALSGVSSGNFSTWSSGNYKNNQECSWLIMAPNEPTIMLSFSSFNTELNDDLVRIYRCSNAACNGVVYPAYILSGNDVSASTTYTSDSGFMKVAFASDDNGRRAGFEAQWSVLQSASSNASSPVTSSSTASPLQSSTPASLALSTPDCVCAPAADEEAPFGYSWAGSTFPLRAFNTVMRVRTSFPSAQGCLFEGGGKTRGTFIGIVNTTMSQQHFRFTAGDGSNPDASLHASVIMIPLPDARIPQDGSTHEVTVSWNVDENAIRLMIDGVFVSANSSVLKWPNKKWVGSNPPCVGRGCALVPDGGTSDAWRGAFDGNMKFWNSSRDLGMFSDWSCKGSRCQSTTTTAYGTTLTTSSFPSTTSSTTAIQATIVGTLPSTPPNTTSQTTIALTSSTVSPDTSTAIGDSTPAATNLASATPIPVLPETEITVEVTIVMAIVPKIFSRVQPWFLRALSASAGVKLSETRLLDVVQQGQRRSAGNSSTIVSGLCTDDPGAVAASLTLRSLNDALQAQGLPAADSLDIRILAKSEFEFLACGVRCRHGSSTYGVVPGNCSSKCGDGWRSLLEECDDGNLENGDGCNRACALEESSDLYGVWKCRSGNFSSNSSMLSSVYSTAGEAAAISMDVCESDVCTLVEGLSIVAAEQSAQVVTAAVATSIAIVTTSVVASSVASSVAATTGGAAANVVGGAGATSFSGAGASVAGAGLGPLFAMVDQVGQMMWVTALSL